MYLPDGFGPSFASKEAKAASRFSPFRCPLLRHFPDESLCLKS
jgi:hypothetical protein